MSASGWSTNEPDSKSQQADDRNRLNRSEAAPTATVILYDAD